VYDVPPLYVLVTPVGVEGAETAGRLERITLDTAIEEVPAAFVAVANALK
jgi:hypothetical protein